MKKLYTLVLGLIFMSFNLYSVEYNLFTAGEGNKFLQDNFNLKGWELFQINSSWYPGDSTIIFDFANGRSSYWFYTFVPINNNTNPKSWSFILTKINEQFTPLDFGVEDDEFVLDYAKLPQNWMDSDLLPMTVQANSNLGQFIMEHFEKLVEFNALLTPKYITEETYPDGMWWLSAQVNGYNEPAYCIFESTTLEKVECLVPEVNSASNPGRVDFKIFPSPAKDFIFIEKYAENAEINMFNALGESLYSIQTNGNSSPIKIYIHNYPEGLYFIKSGQMVKPFIINR